MEPNRRYRRGAALVAGMALLISSLFLGAAAVGATQPSSPPGQGECEHGNSGQECRPDPQPSHGQDCDEHGPFEGGVNEDHCTPEATPSVPPTPTPTPAAATPTATPTAPATPSTTPTPSSTPTTTPTPDITSTPPPLPTDTPTDSSTTTARPTLPPTDAAPTASRDTDNLPFLIAFALIVGAAGLWMRRELPKNGH